MRHFVLGTTLVALIASGWIFSMAAEPSPQSNRSAAKELMNAGNFREALERYRTLIEDENNSGQPLAEDLSQAFQCLNRLRRQSEIDDLLTTAIETHEDDWRAFWSSAQLLRSAPHYGFTVAGEFERGQARGGGEYTSSEERDYVQSLQWFRKADELKPEKAPQSANFYNEFASVLRYPPGGTWKLQLLTDLDELPDYEPAQRFYGRFGGGGSQPQGAPVDADGKPIFYSIPESFEAAQNDGERWRWCLQQEMQADPRHATQVQMQFADFLSSQFSVRTLLQWNIRLPEPDENEEAGVWALSSLTDAETICRLATGVERLTLPDEFNHIKIFQSLVESESPYEEAFNRLIQIYEDRQQYPRAVELLQEKIERFNRTQDKNRLKQIVGNWGQFEGTPSQPAGEGATIDYRYRNGSEVKFEAVEIKVEQLLKDVMTYLEDNPQEVQWEQTNIDNLGYRLVEQGQKKYLGRKVATWTTELEPRANHFDRRTTITTPLQSAGAYLVTAKMKDGNTSRVIIWLDDTAIVRKPLNNKLLYFIADAQTGKPIERAKVEFFGWRQERVPNTKRDYRVVTERFAEFSDADGMIVAQPQLLTQNRNWIAIARTDDGRFSYLGFNGAWYRNYNEQSFRQVKAYFVSDRPVYRPSQTVEFKFWVRDANYEKEERSEFANQNFTVKLVDPQGTEVYTEMIRSDEFGGVAGKYELPEEAKLGSYSFRIEQGRRGFGGGSFRVEEYKKPEFEVTIDAPDKPVQLGDTIKATIEAKYYYGAPVTNAKVKFKVERTSRDARWYPVTRWDWLYGNGYWWYASDYEWYPGFSRWGCFAPIRPWWNWNPDPPELVLDREVEIGEDGTVEVEIDTELAKVLHGDSDHAYSITAEVTDASRRTIVGQGEVLVAREPFKVFTWTDHGHYRVGDKVTAHFYARTMDSQGVQGEGQLKLFRITYEDGKPNEQLAQQWDLNTEEDGRAEHVFDASQPGQYRLSYTLTAKMDDGKEAAIEGGYLFVVRGDGFDGSDFKFNDLELIANKQTYQPGENVELLINTNRLGSTVLLFTRPSNGVYQAPQVLKLDGKSTVVNVPVVQTDMPNFFIEAVTISDGEVHTVVQQVAVPPEKRVIDVEVVSSSDRYQPGEKAEVELKLTDENGKPFQGAVAMTVYDRAVEYISGGSNIPEIRKFFWDWKRNHRPSTEHNLDRYFSQMLKRGEQAMADLGAFGRLVADFDDRSGAVDKLAVQKSKQSRNGRSLMLEAADAMPMAAAMAPGAADDEFSGEAGGIGGFGGGGGGPAVVEPTVRTKFADTAFWAANLIADANGIAKVSFDMPENLGGWKIRAWGMGHGTNVGEGSAEVVTAKNIVVRLQAPRFFTETDEVVLSAVVHNYLEQDKQVRVELELGGGTLEPMNDDLISNVLIKAGGETRVDWRVKAVAPGTATVTMKALTDEESDAMQMDFPVQVHGILKTESFSGVVRADENQGTIEFSVPEDRKPEQSRLEVRYSPTLAGAMVDALPYLVEYPYGCTEQTLNRFVPTVITQNILQKMGVDLKELKRKTTNLNAQEIGDDQERAKQWKRYDRNPVFNEDTVALMVKKGVKDLTEMQNSDGGWGWFSGYGEQSYPHTTAVVVHGLQLAQQNDIAIVDGVVERGITWLKGYQQKQVELLLEGERREKLNDKQEKKHKKPYKNNASNMDAMVFNVLCDAGTVNREMERFLYRDRLDLTLYSQAIIGLAFDTIGSDDKRDMIIRNLDQFLTVDNENQTAYLDLPNNGYWWFWYGNTIEANAHYLKLLTRVNPKDPKASGLVKYILNNRKHGTYWNSTRDTAYCIEALADYLVASGEAEPHMAVEVWLDGQKRKTVEITPDQLFTFDNAFVIEGDAVTAGEHTLELRKVTADGRAASPLYYNAYLTNFTTEDFITATGLEIKVGRKFYKLVQDEDATGVVAGSRGQAVEQKELKYNRIELENLSEVVSGDLIEIELEIDSKNDYEYIIFEDLKAAGCEPVDLQSGYTKGSLGAYVEFRDEKVAFFMRRLARGKHSVSYRLRAEVPGKFSALPTKASAMYAPELKANADEMKIIITDE